MSKLEELIGKESTDNYKDHHKALSDIFDITGQLISLSVRARTALIEGELTEEFIHNSITELMELEDKLYKVFRKPDEFQTLVPPFTTVIHALWKYLSDEIRMNVGRHASTAYQGLTDKQKRDIENYKVPNLSELVKEIEDDLSDDLHILAKDMEDVKDRLEEKICHFKYLSRRQGDEDE